MHVNRWASGFVFIMGRMFLRDHGKRESFRQRVGNVFPLLMAAAISLVAIGLAGCGNYGPLKPPADKAQQQGTGK